MSNTLKFGNGEWATKDGSALAYNDENNNFKPLPFDFTRASSATVINRDGLIEKVGNNIPRIDFQDNTEGAMLLEPQSTNLITQSEAFGNGYWTKSGSSVTSGFISPDGTLNAFKLVEDTSTSEHILYSSTPTLTLGNDYTSSFYVKANGRDTITIKSYHQNQWAINATFDLTTKVVTNTLGIGKIDELTNDWFRISVTGECLITGSTLLWLNLGTNIQSYTGDGTSGIYLFGAQLEALAYPTSYIPTEGTVVTRLADTASGAGNADTFNDSEGVLMAEISALADDLTFRRFTISDNSYVNTIDILLTNSSNQIRVLIRDGSSTTSQISHTVNSIVESNKIAFKYKSGNNSLWINGLNVGNTSDTFTLPSLTDLSFDRGDGANPFYGKTKQLQYFNTILTDSELEELTSWSSFLEMAQALNYNII